MTMRGFTFRTSLFIECANILWKKVQRGEVDVQTAMDDLADLAALDLDATPCAALMTRALALACAHGLSAYDGCYVALAERQTIPLVTADERLVQKLAGSAHPVLSLSELQTAGY